MRKKIQKIREEIRKKDREIVRLLNERGSLSVEVGRIKNQVKDGDLRPFPGSRGLRLPCRGE